MKIVFKKNSKCFNSKKMIWKISVIHQLKKLCNCVKTMKIEKKLMKHIIKLMKNLLHLRPLSKMIFKNKKNSKTKQLQQRKKSVN